ncbi:MAG: SIS domain-containing protein [Myxococcales bacterium]|nr:SIS domain-containing protein [Myxococcales bacterium]
MSRDRALEHFLSVAPAELGRVAERLDRAALERAVELILAAEEKGARVHVTGIGKAEQVARYAAGLLSSTGTPATFLDGTGAVHGGVGQLRPEDVLVAISNSGETSELLRCCEVARALGARLVALTGAPASGLARAAEIVLECGVADEGGPLGLAPRASVLAQLLAAAALSVALQDRKQFSREAYHQRHPAGALGRRSDSGD